MNYPSLFLSTILVLTSSQAIASHPPAQCGATAPPLLSVADFDADGHVTKKDITALVKHKNSGHYYALYDRNADGQLDKLDVNAAKLDKGKTSTVLDRKLANLYQQTKVLQTASGYAQLQALGFTPITSALAGHGVHWANVFSDLPVSGINVLEDGSAVKAVYFSQNALPLFNDVAAESGLSPLDYPSLSGAWLYERVQAFGDLPPTKLDPSLQNKWHTHAGLCITVQDNGSGAKFVLDQHTSFMECQVIPSQVKVPYGDGFYNAWLNIWMLHTWLFDLNPAGTYAGTHPCVDPQAPSESDINGDREVPLFFQHHE